ncbi:hypothetical protein GSI_00671 [Ganoderma sinense ZZ0214-1]|uniref:AB hydrolase-1 domain-containing protein n=1 Tax=Ganoderma sinense ZZ0214-1 TaxID=1077348 RepID=A0A2G8ST76_9APHY|nr:hypothetical protein GSI_00671 [Ganoderma sinense ZZ0214-1]
MSNPSDTQAAAPNTVQTIPQTTTDPTDLVLLIFIHGFKGTDSTFGEFPQRLQHILSESIDNTVVESVVFPAYETKGELNAAVVRFADWLTDLTVKREVANGGAGKAKVVLCGHSMGGLLAADALLEFVRTRPDKRAPLWPKIVACIAYDTPYLGLHPGVVKNGTNQAAQYARTAQNVLNSFRTWRSKTPSGAAAAAAGGAAAGAAVIAVGPAPIDTNTSPDPDTSKDGDETPKSPTTKTPTGESSEGTTVTSLWQKWAAPAALAIGGVVLAGTAAGTAYYKREEIGVGYTWVTDHLKYIGNLWSKEELEERLDRLLTLESRMGVLFHTFFTDIPASPPAYPSNRTFIVLPHRNSPLATHFMPNRNTLASDEIQAHTGMFDTKTNDGYYQLGLVTAKLIREAVFRARRVEADAQTPKSLPSALAQPRAPLQQPSTVKPAAQESVASPAPPASTAAVSPPAVAGGVAAAATTVAAASAASVAASASAPRPPAADDEDEEDDDDDDEDEEEEEEEEEHIPVMEKPHIMAEKVDATQAASAPKADEEAEDEEDDEEDDEDEDDDEEEDEDDEDEDEEDEDEDEEEGVQAQPAKK